MSSFIDGIDFENLEAEKYWSFPKSYKGDAKEETRNMIFSNDYIGARKVDGAYYRFIKDDAGNMRLQGRSKSVNGDYLNKLDHVPHLMDFFNSLPNGTCLVGEVYFPNNEGSSNVTKIMGCLPDKAIKRQETGDKLYYYVFDVYAYQGHSLLKYDIGRRIQILYEIEDCWKEDMAELGLLSYINFAKYSDGKMLWDSLQWILANGGEGIVMTRKGTCPSPGKRTARKTLKVKKELQENIDCFFTGKFSQPTRAYTGKEIKTWKYWEDIRTGEKIEGNYYEKYSEGASIEPVTKPYFHDWASSLEIGVLDDNDKIVPIGTLSGLPDEMKAEPQKYAMKCIEVAAMEVLPTGGIRHGKMLRFRPDLNVHDCTLEKFKNQ